MACSARSWPEDSDSAGPAGSRLSIMDAAMQLFATPKKVQHPASQQLLPTPAPAGERRRQQVTPVEAESSETPNRIFNLVQKFLSSPRKFHEHIEYKAKDFNTFRAEYIRARHAILQKQFASKRESYIQAQREWSSCRLRKVLLHGMTDAEKARRRFT